MGAIFRKEISSFFSSIAGYMAIILFLVANGLFLFVFPDTSLLDYGYASLDKLFSLAPWIYLLLIPAITMRSFSEEQRTGTLEILGSKPLRYAEIIAGKYLAALVLIFISLLPTLVYYYTISRLSNIPGDLDNGGIAGSYIGLFLLGAVFAAIGSWSSSISNNPVTAFLVAAFCCFFIYWGFDAISKLPVFLSGADYYIEMAGIRFHYDSISRGVVDSRDLIYFFSVILIFLSMTRISLTLKKS
ncbi:MAG TPA: gliding motility-associated ABC transporter permease subunit GldF [Chitinophagaceae bacterium]|nr:gliding motility-associated ABC transporter permease subunit GldF [Chitinophagaceae bacterium]